MTRLSIVSVSLTLSCLAAPAFAAEAVCTLGQALDTVAARHPAIRAAEKAIDAARAREAQVAAPINPNLTLTVDQVPLPDPIGGNYMAGVTQPLMLGGLREARAELARLERVQAELGLQEARLEVATRVKEAYWRLLFEEQGVAIARLDAEAAAVALKSAQSRYQAGEVARLDVLRAEVESGRAERELADAEGRRSQAGARLNLLMGRSADAALALENRTVTGLKMMPLDALVTQAQTTRVALQAAALTIEREAAQRQVAQASLWTGTEFSVLGGAVGGRPGFTTTLTMPIPLYRQQGEIAEAEANRARAEAEREALAEQVAMEVTEAHREVVADARAVLAYAETYVPQAERLVANARKRLAAGEGSPTEVAEATRAWREASLEQRQAELELRLAVTRLERATGTELWGR